MNSDFSPERGALVIAKFAADLAEKPGVYQMFDHQHRVLYIGKAKRLKRRVASYAQLHRHNQRILTMIAQVVTVEVIHTRNEIEALLLEMNLIKSQKPRYNILLRDDKSFPYVLVRKDHDFPQIVITREKNKSRGTYHGPFGSGLAARDMLDQLQRAFLIRSCNDSVFENRQRPCLLYQIKRCCAPCVNKISKDKYQELIEQSHQVIKGKSALIIRELSQKMQQASEQLQFEEAARLRDRIESLKYMRGQGGAVDPNMGDADVFALVMQNHKTCVHVFFYRKGHAHGSRAFFPRQESHHTQSQIMLHVIGQLYTQELPPSQIFVNILPEEKATLELALSEQRKTRAHIILPIKGQKKELVQQSLHAASEALSKHLSEHSSRLQQFKALGELLAMSTLPNVVEIFDNSHLQGSHALGAMVVATPEGFQKNRYRKYNMPNNIDKRDDIAMMSHMITRRFSYLKKEDPDQKDGLWPDVVIIDGGKTQLSAAQKALQELAVSGVFLMGIAKGEDRRAGTETLFIPPENRPVKLDHDDPLFFLLQQLRDESHRFVITAHRNKRHKAITRNPLDRISGIGAKRKKLLMQHFGSAKAACAASYQELQAVAGISPQVARNIVDYREKDETLS